MRMGGTIFPIFPIFPILPIRLKCRDSTPRSVERRDERASWHPLRCRTMLMGERERFQRGNPRDKQDYVPQVVELLP